MENRLDKLTCSAVFDMCFACQMTLLAILWLSLHPEAVSYREPVFHLRCWEALANAFGLGIALDREINHGGYLLSLLSFKEETT